MSAEEKLPNPSVGPQPAEISHAMKNNKADDLAEVNEPICELNTSINLLRGVLYKK